MPEESKDAELTLEAETKQEMLCVLDLIIQDLARLRAGLINFLNSQINLTSCFLPIFK